MTLARPFALLLALLVIASSASAQPPDPLTAKPGGTESSLLDTLRRVQYYPHVISGWTVVVSEAFEHQRLADNVLHRIADVLDSVSKRVGPQSLATLRTIPIWLALKLPGFKGNPDPDYHPSAAWLEKNGYDPRWEKSIAIPSVTTALVDDNFPLKLVASLVDGFNDRQCKYHVPGIAEIMDRLHETGKYDQFLSDRSLPKKMTSSEFERRYFIAMSTAYLYGADTYPQTARGVKGFDPKTYELLEAMWSK